MWAKINLYETFSLKLFAKYGKDTKIIANKNVQIGELCTTCADVNCKSLNTNHSDLEM